MLLWVPGVSPRLPGCPLTSPLQSRERSGLEQSGQVLPREGGGRPLTNPLHGFVEGLRVGVWVKVGTALDGNTLLFNL